ncbi:MAG: cation transporting ATPase C-terminal domain-containing protein, partial [Candidatus Paceibacterota bacterium]
EITKNKYVWAAILTCTILIVLVYVVPQMRLVLGLAILPSEVWVVSIVSALIPLVLIQLYKFIRGRKNHN